MTVLDVDYTPPELDTPPTIGVVGCGNIASHHLGGYRHAGYDVVALCDIDEERAVERRDEFFPDAEVYTDADALLARSDVEVVDITTHPGPREGLIERALGADRHVLSQKPFVTDLDVGERLVELADDRGLGLGVQQNSRWRADFRRLRRAIMDGRLGDIHGTYLSKFWDYNRIAGDDPPHRLFFFYAIHYFDILRYLLPQEPERVYATTGHSPTQEPEQPILGQVVVEYGGDATATLSLDGDTKHGYDYRTAVVGDDATAICHDRKSDPDARTVTIHDRDGSRDLSFDIVAPPVRFSYTMGEFVSAVRANREPLTSGRDNLGTVALTLAAIASALDGESKVPGEVRQLPPDPHQTG